MSTDPDKTARGLAGVLSQDGFRRLWIGQIFSQLGDKFYIVLMVFLIAQYWVTDTPGADSALAEAAAAIRINLESRAQPPRRRDGVLMGPEAVWLHLLDLIETWCGEHLGRRPRAFRLLRTGFEPMPQPMPEQP